MAATSTVAPTPDCTDPGHARRFSTRELQAAATAPAAGRLPLHPPGLASGTIARTTVPEAGVARPHVDGPAKPRGVPVRVPRMVAAPGPLVRVWAANAGAGASTIALALADAADARGLSTRVLDAATPAWSGLVGASVTEVGAKDGWRRGRRGRGVLIDRVACPVAAPDLVPAPRDADGIDLIVLDTGWTVRELATASAGPGGCWVADGSAAVEVVVTRGTTQALGQAESVLAELTDTPMVAVVVGPGRRPSPMVATAGPRLRRLYADQAVVCLPRLSARAMPGLGAEPLPRQLMRDSRRLLDRITAVTGPLDADLSSAREEKPTCSSRRSPRP